MHDGVPDATAYRPAICHMKCTPRALNGPWMGGLPDSLTIDSQLLCTLTQPCPTRQNPPARHPFSHTQVARHPCPQLPALLWPWVASPSTDPAWTTKAVIIPVPPSTLWVGDARHNQVRGTIAEAKHPSGVASRRRAMRLVCEPLHWRSPENIVS